MFSLRATLSAAAVAFAMVGGASANAATVYAVGVDWSNNGTVGSSNRRNIPTNALGAPDGKFLSLGLTAADGSNPGFAVFDFGQVFTGPGVVIETTFGCRVSGATCAGHREQVEVWVGSDYEFGTHDSAAITGGFTRLDGLLGNADAQNGGAAFTFTGAFRYLALVDRSGVLRGGSIDGFDVDAVGVTPAPAPLPAALPMLGAALCGLALMSRRRKA
jgi:hypothetical protein